MIKNKYRLSSEIYDRETDSEKILPAKVIFLSVEGKVTEKEYFDNISRYREQLGINANINVEVLRRSDTYSAPKQVIELLEEYLEIRNSDEEYGLKEIFDNFSNEFAIEDVNKFLKSEMTKKDAIVFSNKLRKIGYDYSYFKYLNKYGGPDDEFGIVIDRDQYSNTEKDIRDCIDYCHKKGYLCFISNPCFEFWLLLHLCDVKKELKDNLIDISLNKKISERHTFVSNEVSKRAHHGKGHLNFEKNYLNNVPIAIKRAKDFSCTEEELISNIGTNIGVLIEKLLRY